MKFSPHVLILLVARVALADTIAYGYNQYYGDEFLFMWIEGQDACKIAFTSSIGTANDCYNEGGANVCAVPDVPYGHKFTLTNGKSYKLENCGGAFSLSYYSSGTFISEATYAPWYSNCGDTSGNHAVQKLWQFTCDKKGC